MSNITEKYKRLLNNNIFLNHTKTVRNLLSEENETDSKIRKIINMLYSDAFKDILINSRTLFFKIIDKKFNKIISKKYSEYIIIKKSFIDNLKKEINLKYITEYQLLKKAINNYNKNPKNSLFLTNFIPHCSKTEKIAYHNCISCYGKFIQVKNKDNNIFVICVECQKCFKSDLIEMFCLNCQKNYYSSISSGNHNIQKNLPLATWEKYHCGSIINEIMKCIKCKSNLYYNNTKDKLVCLNKKCKFEVSPKRMIWKCSICSHDFTSSVKAYNPLEIKLYKNAINYAFLIGEKARPFKINYCNHCMGDISKATFYHKKDCKGELYMSNLNNNEVVVCNKCHGINFYSQFSWLCPFCNKKIKNKKCLGENECTKIFNKNKKNNKNNNNSAFSFDYQKSLNSCNKYEKDNSLKMYMKKNIVINTASNNSRFSSFFSNRIPTINHCNSLENKNELINKSNISNSLKRDSVFSIKNLFLRNDSQEKYYKSMKTRSFNNIMKGDKSKNNNSLGKSIIKKSTLYEILQRRNIEKTSSVSRDEKESVNNIINLSNKTKLDSSNDIKNIKKLIYNHYKKKIPNRFSMKEKNINNNTENNISIYNIDQENQKILRKSDKAEIGKKIRKDLYKKHIESKVSELDKDIEAKKSKKSQINKTYEYTNNINNYSIKNDKKQNDYKLKFENKIKEEIDKIKIDNRLNNKKFIKSKNLGKCYKNNHNKKIEFNEIFRNSYNNLSFSNINNSLNSYDKLKNKHNFNTKITKYISLENEKNKEDKQALNNKKTFKNVYGIKPSLNLTIYSRNKKKQEERKDDEKSKIEISLKKYTSDNIFQKSNKYISRRRYYQSINSKDKIKNISNYLNGLNDPLYSIDESEININRNNYSNMFLNSLKDNNNNNIIKDNTNSITNICSNSNTKENYKKEDSKENNNDNDNKNDEKFSKINLIDLEINTEKVNFLSESRINSIINNDLNCQNSTIYNPEKIDEIMKKCNIPMFEDEAYNYKIPIGEGSFGIIYEVEEVKTGNKYAIKKIICKDIQDLIKEKTQLELLYSIEHENIMKISKIQIKCLDFTTYSINVLMELALRDWGQDISFREKNKIYYKEEELINITKQIIKGLLFLKKKNIAHRDIKPQNILIFPNNIFKLADFGEAKTVNNLSSLLTLKGCELYMSPALYWGWINGKRNLAHNIFKSDIFSLGYCLVYAITLNICVLQKIRRLKDNNEITKVFLNNTNKNIYSQKFIDIICKMIDINEEQRYDIENVNKKIEDIIF